MNELSLRIFSSIILLILFYMMIFGNLILFVTLLQIFQFMCIWEYLRLVKHYQLISKGSLTIKYANLTKTKLGINSFFLIILLNLLNLSFFFESFILFIIFVTLIIFVYSKYFYTNLINLIGLLYVVSPFFLIIILKSHLDFERIFLFAIIFSVLVDSSAYYFGKKIGGIKLASSISPNKTVAGFFAGIIVPTIICLLVFNHGNILNIFLLSIIFSVTFQFGDLIESKFKRICKVKDSSNIIPGHGGALDRLDGMFLFLILISLLIILDYNLFFIQ